MLGVDAMVAIGGLVIPPIFDFIKKKFLKTDQDTPEATMSTLATTSPDALGPYVAALSGYWENMTKYFNRDIAGTPSQWVVDIRAAIRPAVTLVACAVLILMTVASLSGWKVDPTLATTLDGVRYNCELIVSSWFGSRISLTAPK